jgi:amidohydrolase
MATTLELSVKSILDAELPSLIARRHDLHTHPELCFQERRTSRVIQDELSALGIDFKAGMGVPEGSKEPGTGVIGYLPATEASGRGKGGVALRADMDALPILEATGKPYASATPGLMHACGHDGHVTMLLGAARILSKLPRPRPVLLLFQPAEEGGGGGERMCVEGALDGEGKGGLGAPVEMMFGLHGWPTREIGTVASRVGALLAATDDFEITVRGTQSHGAYPHFGNDPIVAAAQIITALQTIASRNVGPLDSIVVTVGAINAGTADNIIPGTCTFIGTIRTLRDETRALAKRRFFEICGHTAQALGCVADIDWKPGYPVTENHPAATEAFFRVANQTFPSSRVIEVDHPTMGGEDFAYYCKKVPSCFFFLGLKPHGATHFPTLHQPDFDFNDEALPVGIEMMCQLALKA